MTKLDTETIPETETPTPTVAELAAEDALTAAIRHRWELAQEVKALEADIKRMSAYILTALTDRSLTEYEAGDHVATVVSVTRTSLSERKLMDRGIPLHILKECKDESTSTYVKVSKREAKEPEITF